MAQLSSTPPTDCSGGSTSRAASSRSTARRASRATKRPYDGQLAPGAPDDTFWALGYGNEYVAVIPSEGVVAVRMGSRPDSPNQLTFESFTSGTLKALS